MSRWQRILRALGVAWRPATRCPHPADRARWSDGCAYEPAGDVDCADCGATLYVGGNSDYVTEHLTDEGKRSEWARA